MASAIQLKNLPGYKTAKAIYAKLPGKGKLKAVLVAAGVGALVVAAIAVGYVGVAALVGGSTALLSAPAIVSLGIIAALPVVYSFIVGGIQQIFNFNWNATDVELDKQIQSQLNVFYGMTGNVLGSALGYITCGALPGVVAFAFNPAVAKVALRDVNEEAKEEVYSQLATIAQGALRTLVNAVTAKAFKSARRWLKRPDSPFYDILKSKLGKNFTQWGDASRPNFTISTAIDDRVEDIKDERLRNFTEEFLESFSDSCIDAGYIVVNSISSQMAAQKMMQEQLLGKEEIIELTFERGADDNG